MITIYCGDAENPSSGFADRRRSLDAILGEYEPIEGIADAWVGAATATLRARSDAEARRHGMAEVDDAER
ncbi:MAG: hypothetical protein Q8M76_14685 [Spirochaetaceae bacterium]|nr:hypothetical protein [Spirochaetaceae bacterium]